MCKYFGLRWFITLLYIYIYKNLAVLCYIFVVEIFRQSRRAMLYIERVARSEIPKKGMSESCRKIETHFRCGRSIREGEQARRLNTDIYIYIARTLDENPEQMEFRKENVSTLGGLLTIVDKLYIAARDKLDTSIYFAVHLLAMVIK